MREEAEWIWDPDGIDWGIGAWRCSLSNTIVLLDLDTWDLKTFSI